MLKRGWQLVQILLEDRKRRDEMEERREAEQTAERERKEAEQTVERERREAEHDRY